MKIITFDTKITPEVGTEIAGYGEHDVTWEVHDDLWLNGLLLDDGRHKAAILGFDLIGMHKEIVHTIRTRCAALLGAEEKDIVLSCTHTHGGPHSRITPKGTYDKAYCAKLFDWVEEGVRQALTKAWTEVDVYFYSARAFVNTSRRYCGPENICKTLFVHRELEPLCDGFTDPEIGMLFFRDAATRQPVETLINYAAHPLASHCRGLGGHAITADYPGLIRKLICENTLSHCTFVSGAAGDMFPIDSEIGWQNLDTIAKPIVREVMLGMVNAFENPQRFKMEDPEIKTLCAPFTAGLRPDITPERRKWCSRNTDHIETELQLLSIGDICFVGVPGEVLAEVGQEIKWNTPFRRAYVLYNSTDYLDDYICHTNAIVAGGYEGDQHQTEYRSSLKLLNTAVDAMFQLYGDKVIPRRNWRPSPYMG